MNKRLRKYAWGDYYGNTPMIGSTGSGFTQVNIGTPYSFSDPKYNLDIPNYQQFKNTPYYYDATSLNDRDRVGGFSFDLNFGGNSAGNTAGKSKGNFANSSTGAAIGTAASALAGAINSGQEKGEVTAAVDEAAGVVPLWGQLVQLGRAIGGGVEASDPTDRYTQGFSNAISPSAALTRAIDDGDTEGALLGLLAPGLGATAASEREEKKIDKQRREEENRLRMQSQSILANYPVYGVAKYGMKFPMGGKLPYPTDNSSYQVLSSDSARYDGKTHENGGIKLDTDMDGKPEIEVEDNEVIKDNMVYSDRINPSTEYSEFANSQGIKISNSESYASAIEKIEKKKGKYEVNLKAPGAAGDTARLMTERLEGLGNILFEDQQMQKLNFGEYSTKYAIGGEIGNDPNKKKLPKDVVVSYTETMGDKPLVKVDEEDPLFYDRNQFINYYRNKTVNAFTPDDRVVYDDILTRQGAEDADSFLALRGGLPNFDNYIKLVRDYEKTQITNPTNWNELNYSGNTTGGYRYNARRGKGLPAKGSTTVPRYAYGDYYGDVLAGVGTGVNQLLINQLETDYTPDEVGRPQYTYTNRLPFLTNQIGSQFRSASRGLSQSSQQDNAALKANLYAKSLGALNEATDRELLRKNAYDTNYEQLAQRSDFFNTQNRNAAKVYGLENRNQRVAMTQANIDNLIRSYQGNQTMRQAKQLDADKAYMSLVGDYTGAGRRFYDQLPEELRKRYNWNFTE